VALGSIKKTAFLKIGAILSFTLSLSVHASVESSHGIAMHGDLKYDAGFSHFEYVNPEAPKGGVFKQAANGTFDSFNPFIIKGTAADGTGLTFDTLMARSYDEPFTQYGLLAEAIRMPESRSWIEFDLRKQARFSDGTPVTANDVIETFKLLREQGSPFYKAYYRDISSITALTDHTVRFEFGSDENRELPLIIGEVPILSANYWKERDFTKPSLEPILGSGPYVVDSFEAGRTITYKRNPEYWGADLPVNRGRYNFDAMQFDYYRDSTVALEAFKAQEYDFREENSSKNWATAYTGPAFDEGRIKKELIEDANPAGMQAFIMNTRLEKFSDPRVRSAIAHGFDFEWTNANLFYSAYTRSHSFFSNSEMAATELPTEQELEILEPFRGQIPDEVFNQVYQAPTTKGDGRNRTQLRTALKLLKEAGWTLKNGKLINASGESFNFEILLVQKDFERVVAPFIQNLEKLGMQVSIRIVDVSQYINRLRSTDFDMIVGSFGQSSSPGNEQREFWGSEAADQPGSRNLIGIKDPAIDQLVELLIQAPNREQLVLRARALDRVLQWNHFVVPQFHIDSHRVAYWDKFEFPAIRPTYTIGLDTWWAKP
jgi:microcin C transport system substrate-binding protein